MSKIIIGVDIGGTTIKIGLIQLDGNILDKWEIPTNKENNGNLIVSEIWHSIHHKLQVQNINKDLLLGIGVGAPAFIDGKTGLVLEAVNIGWKNVNVKEQLMEKSNLPVFIENDANTAALGEYWIGSGQGSANMMVATIGTGIGGGIITNGSILNGENGMAGEIGHIKLEQSTIPCSCGGIGCLETICSATGIKRQALQVIEDYPDSPIAEFYREHGDVTAKDVMDFAKNGDELCLRLIDFTANVLGKALANIAAVISPSSIILGGGVSKSGEFLLHRVRTAFQQHAIPKIGETCQVKAASLGNDAGIIGSAYLVKSHVL